MSNQQKVKLTCLRYKKVLNHKREVEAEYIEGKEYELTSPQAAAFTRRGIMGSAEDYAAIVEAREAKKQDAATDSEKAEETKPAPKKKAAAKKSAKKSAKK